MKQDKISYTETGISTITLTIPVSYTCFELKPKDKLIVLKRAQKLLKEEIKRVEEQILQSEIKASGQIDLEQAIEEEIQHVRNKNGYS